MDDFAGVVGAAIGAFAGTNVDDLIVLAVPFTASRSGGQPRVWEVWAGQYLGIAALVAASVVAALGLTVVSDEWVGLLGLIPLALGVRGLVRTIRSRDDEVAPRAPEVAGSMLAVSAVTIANGADNIAIYTPLFRTISRLSRHGRCVVRRQLAVGLAPHGHRRDRALGHWLVPAVFIVIGALIVLESGVIRHSGGGVQQGAFAQRNVVASPPLRAATRSAGLVPVESVR